MAEGKSEYGMGCILGALVGDAAGAYLEFIGHQPGTAEVDEAMKMPGGGCWKLAPGQITDDGELTLCLAQALLAHKTFNIEEIARWYARWYVSPPFDIGNTTDSSIGCIKSSTWKPVAEEQGFATAMSMAAQKNCMGSKANGSLMRATPLGVWGHQKTDEELAEMARLDSSLSHPHSSCWQAVAAYNIAIAELINNNQNRTAAWNRARNWILNNADEELHDWLKLIESDEHVPGHPQAGFVKIAFVHAFQSLIKDYDFTTAIRKILELGGDTDTNACIVGGLIGAAVGLNGIPKKMSEAVLLCDTSDGWHPRPNFLVPGKVFTDISRLMAE